MALNIRNAETEQLATELAKLTGETKTRAVTKALKERLDRETRRPHRTAGLVARLTAIGKHCAALPVLDGWSGDELLYDEAGVPK